MRTEQKKSRKTKSPVDVSLDNSKKLLEKVTNLNAEIVRNMSSWFSRNSIADIICYLTYSYRFSKSFQSGLPININSLIENGKKFPTKISLNEDGYNQFSEDILEHLDLRTGEDFVKECMELIELLSIFSVIKEILEIKKQQFKETESFYTQLSEQGVFNIVSADSDWWEEGYNLSSICISFFKRWKISDLTEDLFFLKEFVEEESEYSGFFYKTTGDIHNAISLFLMNIFESISDSKL